MAGKSTGEDVDYVESLYKRVQEKNKIKGIAKELFENREYSAAREILKNLLPQQDEGDARLDMLLQIGECDVGVDGKLTKHTEEEIMKTIKTEFPSYIEVVENAKQHQNISAVIMYLYGCKVAKEQAAPDRAVTEIESCMSETKSIMLAMGRDSDTGVKRIANKAMPLMHEMADVLETIEGADETKKAVVEGDCFNKIGYVYNDLSRHRSARPFLEKGRKIMETKLAENASRYHIFASLANNIAYCYGKDGEHTSAATYYGKATADLLKAVDATEKYRSETLADYEAAYVRHLSDPSVKPADVTRISDMVEKEKASTTSRVGEDPPPNPYKRENAKDASTKAKDLVTEDLPAENLVAIGNGIMVDYSNRIQEGCNVFKGRFGGRVVAVKRMEFSAAQCAKCIAEVENVKKLKAHPNLVEYIEIYEKESAEMPGIKFLYIAMELCEKETLYELAASESFSHKDRVKSFLHVMIGLMYLHKHDIVHGDLRSNNVLRSLDGRHFRISDCGLSSASLRGTRTQIGAYGRPPEKTVTAKWDVYSAGLVFYHVFTMGDSEGVVDLNKLRFADAEISKDVASAMLEEDQGARPSAEDVLKHPFFWGNEKRLCFYRDVADSLSVQGTLAEQLTGELNAAAAGMFNKKSATDTTHAENAIASFAEETEVEVCNTNVDAVEADKTNVESDASTNKTSASALLRFIRDKLSDAAKNEENGSDELWDFLSKQFPQLFTLVYRLVSSRLDEIKLEQGYESNYQELSSYFENTATGCVEPTWTDERKFRFLCKVSEEDELSDLYKDAADGVNWMTSLALSEEEMEAIQVELAARGSRIRVEKWAVFNRSLECIPSKEVEDQQESLEALLRFVNHLGQNFQRDGNQIKAIFHNNSKHIWEFLKRRFPMLFQQVRNSVSVSPRYDSLVSQIARQDGSRDA